MPAAPTPPADHAMTMREWGLLFLLAGLWSASYLFQRFALWELPVATIVLGRVGLAALVLLAVVYASGDRMPRDRGAWGGFLVMSLLNNVFAFGLIISAQRWIDSGLAAILVGTTPLMSAVLSRALGNEALGPLRAGGIVVGIGGLAVLIGPEALGGLGQGFLGQVMVLGGALSYALAAIYGLRFKAMPPMVTAAGQLVCSTLMALPAAALLDQPWTLSPSWGAVASILALSLVSTAVAYVVYFRILATAGATNNSLVTLLVPVGAVVLGAIFAGETLDWQRVAGMALIGGGLLLIDGRLVRRLAGRAKPGAPPPR